MSLTLPKAGKPNPVPPKPARLASLRSWLLSWEIYLIVLVAGFLRFYQIRTTEFDDDQALLFRLAYDAVHHGLLPTTSNNASISIKHPPGVIYPLMLPAAFSANPLWGAVMVGVLTTLAALLTYFFARRYYGRLAGIIAALLYATAAKPLNYARFIWQPNMMPPFVVLFMFALFWGVVDRRKGWLFPALLLLAILYQMHEVTLLLAIPLVAALVLAPGTLRWRDLAFGLVSILIVFFPYLLWQFFTHFSDLLTALSLAKQHAHIDTQAMNFYRYFLSPFDKYPTQANSLLYTLAPWLSWLSFIVPLLALGGFFLAGMLLLQPQNEPRAAGEPETPPASFGNRLLSWWMAFRADPYRCGLALLLTWQIVPLLILSRHAVDLHSQYFFMLMPGPFILIGLLIERIVSWSRSQDARASMLRYGSYALVGLVVVAQLVGSTAAVVDASSGNFNDRGFPSYPYHNDLASLQNALSGADQLALQRHLSRIYITMDAATRSALIYLSEHMKTPTTLFDASSCLVLPAPADGPAVMLVGPYDTLTNALLSKFSTATLVDQPPRLGGLPFKLYVVTPVVPSTPASPQNAFVGDLQALDGQSGLLTNSAPWLVTRWRMLRDGQPGLRTTYSYVVSARGVPSGTMLQSTCTLTSMRAGDQLLAAFHLPASSPLPTSVTLQAQSYVTTPYNPAFGPFHLETDGSQTTPWMQLQTPAGQSSIALPVKSA